MTMDIESLIAELRRLADDLAERSRRRDASDPLTGVARAALAEQVASLVRHDMRNKLTSIRNAAFYLKRRVQPTDVWQTDPRVGLFFTLIEDTVVDATRMLDDPLGPRLNPPPQLARVSAHECVDFAVACTAVPGYLRLRVQAGPTVIEADRNQVALALRCLLENAVEASSEGGKVEISTREDGDRLVVAVSDEGPGVSPEATDRVFEPFWSTREGHAGIGLNVARRIARNHGGDVELASTEHGAVATLVVPLADTLESGPRTGVRGLLSLASGGPLRGNGGALPR